MARGTRLGVLGASCHGEEFFILRIVQLYQTDLFSM